MFNFLLTEPIHPAGVQVLEPEGAVRLARGTDEATLIAELQDIDGVVLRAVGRMTRQVMASAPRLKVIGRHGVGVDNIDLEAATELGIQVVNTPHAVTEGVVEHTVALLLDVSKRLTYADKRARAGDWDVRYRLSGREVRGRTLGVIGFGRIGRRVAAACQRGFGMQILYSDVVAAPDLERELGARQVSLEELLRTAEYITVHTPLLPETRHLIDERVLRMMRPDAIFVNCARGAVVDEAALYRALKEGWIAGAGIDVFEQEPTPKDNPLFALDNIVLTPHTATATEEALVEMALVAKDVVRVLKGEKPDYPVNRLP